MTSDTFELLSNLSTSLRDRSFSTLEFYRSLQDDLTPASVNMFQSDWDESVRDTFWNILGM